MSLSGGVGKESVGGFEASPLLKKNNSAQAAAKVLLRKISKPSMLLSPNKPEDAHSALQPRQQTPPNHTLTNGHTRSAPAQEGRVSVLPTVEEKTGGSEEADQLIDTR